MSNTAIILSGPNQRPLVVRVQADDSSLSIVEPDGTIAQVPWWRLYRVSDEGTTHRFQRLDRREWELRVTGGSDQALLAHIGRRPIARILHPLRRLHIFKTIAGLLVLGVAVIDHLPPEWMAGWITPAMERRLVDGPIADLAPRRCSHQGGEVAVRKLLVRLDPQIGRSVEIVGLDLPDFVVSSLPANKIAVTREALQGTDPETLAALLAHELALFRNGDPVVASVRHNGVIGIWGSILEGAGSDLRLTFSGIEERRADLEAMDMLKRARISIRPAAQMFEDMRIAVAQGRSFADAYRQFHFGVDSRAMRWSAAAARQPQPIVPALDRDDSDALFNFCWAGPLPASRSPPLKGPPEPLRPGEGSIGPSRGPSSP
ncbi:MAG: hypothetical protein M3438_03885 [Pseudomonadota bacterium]|nr:hypothetical protein [Sphingomonas sp.]MDQ3478282.1 hypothetical protein [Pseudomonadota bacterium]